MLIESFSHPKAKDRSAPSEDTLLMLPGVTAIFDGATDALGRRYGHLTSGRLASESVANACAGLFAEGRNRDIGLGDLMDRLSQAINTRARAVGIDGKPATTLALVLRTDEGFRFIVAGDSGIRINGTTILRHCKAIDDVSATARIALFQARAKARGISDPLEYDTRQIIFRGFAESLSQGWVTQAEVQSALDAARTRCAAAAPETEIEDFLMAGIQKQNLFANRPDKSLGYSVLNGADPMLRDLIDVTLPAHQVYSVELFSDGYFSLPQSPSVTAWEQEFAAAEDRDLHKVGPLANVKGSTTTEFADDRSVITLRRSEAEAGRS